MDGAMLVSQRRTAMVLEALDMQSDAQEIPALPDGSKPLGWWLAEACSYTGQAPDDQPAESRQTSCQGTAALAVTRERVLGIVSPNDAATPALWWSWSLPALAIETAGLQGVFKKRPKTIFLGHVNGTVELSAVSRLYRNSGRYQAGQEGSLLKVLQ